MEHCSPCPVLCPLAILLLLQLPTAGSVEEFLVIGPSDLIIAMVGSDITLPCRVSPVMNVENMELRWFRSKFSEAVFIYQNHQEDMEEQMDQYMGRTSLDTDLLSQGQAALRIHKVQAAGNGKYTCFFRKENFYEEAGLELKVAGVVSAPQVHITGPEEDGVRVVCMAEGWFPKPQVKWQDPSGGKFLAFSEAQAQDAEGLFSVEAALVVRDSALGNVTCSILNPILDQEKAMAIFIPEPFFPKTSPWKLVCVECVTLLMFLILGAAYYTWRERSIKVQERQQREKLRQDREKDDQKKQVALKAIDELQENLNQRKAEYLAAWRKAQLYAAKETEISLSEHISVDVSQIYTPLCRKCYFLHSCSWETATPTEDISRFCNICSLCNDWRKGMFQTWCVILDPRSANPNIVVSHKNTCLTLTDAASTSEERCSILGLEGITSGRCFWEVEIRNGDKSVWGLGLCRKDVKRIGWYRESPQKGFWVVGNYEKGFHAFNTSIIPLSLRQFPHRLGVFLDHGKGDVSFYNMADGSHIFSFPQTSFSGTIFPYFMIFSGKVSMTICSMMHGPEIPVPFNSFPSSQKDPMSSDSGVNVAPSGPASPLLP